MSQKNNEILTYHQGGKVGMRATKKLTGPEDLSLAYTPGVALPVKEIARDRENLFRLTAKKNLVAVVSDGTAILGLGDLGAEASIPVMEGKAVLFKSFGDVDGWPVPVNHCRMNGLNTGKTDPQRVIDTVMAIAPMYGGINLEDIAAPACFEIEDKLDAMLDIPVFHDDQWGTAVITLSAAMNYCHLAERTLDELKIVINGAGAAGMRICEMLKAAGARTVMMCDTKGVIRSDRTDLSGKKKEHAVTTTDSTLTDAIGDSVFAHQYDRVHYVCLGFTFPICAKTRGEVRYEFDIMETKMARQFYEITRDLHCWDGALRLEIDEGYGTALMVIFTLKAFPGFKVGGGL